MELLTASPSNISTVLTEVEALAENEAMNPGNTADYVADSERQAAGVLSHASEAALVSFALAVGLLSLVVLSVRQLLVSGKTVFPRAMCFLALVESLVFAWIWLVANYAILGNPTVNYFAAYFIGLSCSVVGLLLSVLLGLAVARYKEHPVVTGPATIV